jgi:hypothetical protein
MRCILCGEEIVGYGHNPQPLEREGRCCDDCNDTKVIPKRLEDIENMRPRLKAEYWE